MSSSEPPREIRYLFTFDSGRRVEFLVRLDPETLDNLARPGTDLPDWTRLGFCQCPVCPLKESEHPFCPIAARIVDLVTAFQDDLSYEEVTVRVETPARAYEKRCTLERGIGSLMGIFNVSSGCPVMNRLRPMLDTHLPFSTLEESNCRMLSMYLLAQYYRAKRGLAPDWEFKGFLKLLEEVREVDIAFSRRLREVVIKDANLNALVMLSQYGESAEMSLTLDDLDRLERLFLAAYGE